MGKWMRRLRRGVRLFGELLKYEAATLCAGILKLFCKEYRHLWILAERGQEARDNGYHLFAYIRQNHPERNIVYVADTALPDYERVRALGRTVPYRSFRHYVLCAAAEMKISTHILGYTPSIDSFYMLDKLRVVRGKRAFLQHGILLKDIAWYRYPNVRTDLFVCTLEQEQCFIEERFGYPPGVVQRLGLCRYDALLQEHTVKSQLLIMPTWRSYAVERKTQAQFMQTEYYRSWQAFLANPALDALLEHYQWEAVFYPHFEVQRFLSAFHTQSPCVRLAGLGQADVQTLLMESSVLLTDFSSVEFDFAYLQKPVLYYQFDEARYWDGHYGRGCYSFRENGFGTVVTQQSALFEALEKLLARGGTAEEPYLSRMAQLFPERDGRNCERNYQAIMELWKSDKRKT